jgi:hypothetical protein
LICDGGKGMAIEARNREFQMRLLTNELEHAVAEGARLVRRWSLRENGMQPSELQLAP